MLGQNTSENQIANVEIERTFTDACVEQVDVLLSSRVRLVGVLLVHRIKTRRGAFQNLIPKRVNCGHVHR